MKKKYAIGVTIFGIWFVIDSCCQLYVKLFSPGHYSWYRFILQPLPEKLILLRYILSIAFRIFELTLGVGIFLRSEIFRKLALFMAWFTIAIIYWKHPLSGFVNNAHFVIQKLYPVNVPCQLTAPASIKLIAWVSLGIFYAFDVIVSALTIYYFTRPHIKEEFNR